MNAIVRNLMPPSPGESTEACPCASYIWYSCGNDKTKLQDRPIVATDIGRLRQMLAECRVHGDGPAGD
jgi:hypothetical protein